MSSMTTEELELAFKAHAGELRSFFYRHLKNTETAAELAQETYLRVLRQPPREPVLNVRGFIFRIVRNLIIDHARSRETRDQHDLGMAYLYEVTGESPELFEVVAARRDMEALADALKRLAKFAAKVSSWKSTVRWRKAGNSERATPSLRSNTPRMPTKTTLAVSSTPIFLAICSKPSPPTSCLAT